MRKFWSKEEDKFLLENYATSDKEFLINRLKRTWYAIQNRAKRFNIERERGANFANITYFDNWSDEMSYILGFIYADGCILDRKKDKVLSVAVSEDDSDLLNKMRNRLAPNKKIWKHSKYLLNKKYNINYFRIGSRYMCNRLIKLGVVPKKSKILQFPNIEKQYLSHFIRGYFDGDGSFGVYKNNARINFCSGSEQFLSKLNKIISVNCDVSVKNVLYGKMARAYYLNYHTKEALGVCAWMYNNSTIHLDRKYKKYKSTIVNRA